MSADVSCPTCGQRAEGAAARCPRCGASFNEHAITSEPDKLPAASQAIQAGAPPAARPGGDDHRLMRGIMRPPHQQGWSRAAYAMLGICMAADMMQMLGELNKALALQRVLDGQQLQIDFQRAQMQSNLLAFFAMGLFIATTAVVMTWLYHAYSNLYVLQVGGLSYTPGEAVRACFVPWGLPYMPYRVIQEIWRASDSTLPAESAAWQERAGSRLILAWWLLFLLRHLRINLSVSPFPFDDRMMLTAMTVAAWTSAAACCLGVLAAVLFGIIMMRIQRRQWLRFDRLQQM